MVTLPFSSATNVVPCGSAVFASPTAFSIAAFSVALTLLGSATSTFDPPGVGSYFLADSRTVILILFVVEPPFLFLRRKEVTKSPAGCLGSTVPANLLATFLVCISVPAVVK